MKRGSTDDVSGAYGPTGVTRRAIDQADLDRVVPIVPVWMYGIRAGRPRCWRASAPVVFSSS